MLGRGNISSIKSNNNKRPTYNDILEFSPKFIFNFQHPSSFSQNLRTKSYEKLQSLLNEFCNRFDAGKSKEKVFVSKVPKLQGKNVMTERDISTN